MMVTIKLSTHLEALVAKRELKLTRLWSDRETLSPSATLGSIEGIMTFFLFLLYQQHNILSKG